MSVYHYANNNPIINNDPTGNDCDCGTPDNGGDADGGANPDPYTNGSAGIDGIDGSNGQIGNTGGGGVGDPNIDYSSGVPSNSTTYGGTYNNVILSNVTITAVTIPTTVNDYTNNDNNDGSINVHVSITLSHPSLRYHINALGRLDASTITISRDIPGTIPNVDLIGGQAVGGDVTGSQGGNWFTNIFVGGTSTVQNGVEGEIESDYGDKYRLAAYHSTTTGDEKLFNVNTTTFINQRGEPSTTVDYSLNLYFYKLKVNLTNIGIEQEVGIGPYMQTSFGISVAEGYSYSGSIGSYGVQGSARPGLYTLGGVGIAAGIIFFPEITIPVLSSQIK